MIARNTGPKGLRLVVAGLAAAGLLLAAGAALYGAPPNEAVRFTIVDAGHRVESDGGGEYVDYRLDGGTGDECMETTTSGGGYKFIDLNRTVDGGRCDLAGGIVRQFRLHIHSADACDELVTPARPGALPNATSTGPETCVMDGHINPRIRVDRLRQSGGTTTIDFMIGRNPDWQSGDVTYQVNSVEQADVTVAGDDLVMTYNGPFRLVRFGLPKAKGKPGSGPPEFQFDMSLEIVFRIESY